MAHLPGRFEGLVSTRQMEIGGELMQFLLAVNWMQTALSALASVVLPMWEL